MTAPRRGQTLVEYGLVLMLIAIFVIGAVNLLGGDVNSLFSSTSSAISGDGSSGSGGSGSSGAEFSYFPANPLATDTVSFDGDDTASSWSWDFGDGIGTSTLEDPEYAYATAGSYAVTLTTNLGTKVLGVEVGPAGPCSGGLATNESYSWDDGAELIAHPYDPAPQAMLTPWDYFGGAEGTTSGATFGNEPVGSRSISVCASGATFTFAGWSHPYGTIQWPCGGGAWDDDADWSWGVRWFDAANNLLRTDIIADHRSEWGWMFDSATLTSPAGTAYMKLAQNVSDSCDQTNNTFLDEIEISLVSAP